MTEPNETTADKYFKLTEPASGLKVGEVAEARLRLLEWPGVQAIQHWIGPDSTHMRPYNCPNAPRNAQDTWHSKNGCPACTERQVAKLKGEEYRNVHRMSKKIFVNVLDLSGAEPKLKIFSMGPSIITAIETLTTRKGRENPTTYDLTLVKRKTGNERFNVEYSVFYEDVRQLSDEEKEAAKTLYDLSGETQVASNDAIAAAIKGQPTAQYVDADTAKQVVARLAKHKMKLEDIDAADEAHIPTSKAKEVLEGLPA